MFRSLGFAVLFLAVVGCERPYEIAIHEGDAEAFREDYARAAKAYEAALLELQESGPKMARLRAETLIKLGEIRQNYLDDLDGALRAFRSASSTPIEALARDARLRTARLFRHRLGDAKSASRELGLLLQNPGFESVPMSIWLEAASTAFAAAEYERALDLAQKVIGSGEAELVTPARELCASIYLLDGRLPEALAALETLRTEAGDLVRRTELSFETARILEKLGRLDDAKQRYEEAKTSAPSEVWLQERLRKLDEALATREKEAAPVGSRVVSGTSIRN